MTSQSAKIILSSLFSAGLAAIAGDAAVAAAISRRPGWAPTRILAIGKAAVRMYEGCLPDFAEVPTLIVTKDGHAEGAERGAGVEMLEAAHPVPDARSLAAGELVRDWVAGASQDDRLLVLLSGGASALVEAPIPGKSLAEIRALTVAGLADGSSIDLLNARRTELSDIKGGKLLSRFPGREIEVFAVSDVAGDGLDTIGSGLGARGSYSGRYGAEVIVSNIALRAAIQRAAEANGIPIARNEQNLDAPIEAVAERILDAVGAGPSGAYVFGGEPTVVLPPKCGKGGRAQALALLLARGIRGRSDLTALVAGSDGTDGVSHAAGAVVDGSSFASGPDAEGKILAADSGTYFEATGEALVTGPTGTNVADIALVLKSGWGSPSNRLARG